MVYNYTSEPVTTILISPKILFHCKLHWEWYVLVVHGMPGGFAIHQQHSLRHLPYLQVIFKKSGEVEFRLLGLYSKHLDLSMGHLWEMRWGWISSSSITFKEPCFIQGSSAWIRGVGIHQCHCSSIDFNSVNFRVVPVLVSKNQFTLCGHPRMEWGCVTILLFCVDTHTILGFFSRRQWCPQLHQHLLPSKLL